MKLNIDFEKKNSVCKEPYTYKKVVLKLTENIVFVCNVTKIVNTLVEKILVVSPLVSSSLFTVFPRIITGGDYFYFRSKGAIIRGKAIISSISHRRLRPKYFVLVYTHSVILVF